MGRNPDWTEEETILALYLYYKLPSAKHDSSNSEVIELAHQLHRSPNAVSLKLGNLKANDSSSSGKGLKNCSHWDRELPPLYLGDPYALFARRDAILVSKYGQKAEQSETSYFLPAVEEEQIFEDVDFSEENKTAIKHIRLKQYAFRQALLLGYRGRCCLSGIGTSDLLIASHIIPWSEDTMHRGDPRNGLLLNALLDKAFDNGYFTIIPDSYEVRISNRIEDEASRQYLQKYAGKAILLPGNRERWPKKDFLAFHNEVVFERFKGQGPTYT
ncbi:HNH endonuclease [Sphaerochaeta pleomorpha]|nr:HNH endonuclease [Sphaerochaeta pleomorpha]